MWVQQVLSELENEMKSVEVQIGQVEGDSEDRVEEDLERNLAAERRKEED